MTPHLLLTLPVAFPLIGLALCALFWRNHKLQRAVSLLASVGLLSSSVALLFATHDGTVIATQFGSWAAPFGISFVADMFAAAMVLITGIMAVAVGVYGLALDAEERERAFFHPLYQGLLLGVTGAFLTGDIFNLYVWFEIMLISSFGLLAAGGGKEQLDAGVKYVALNLIATIFFLISVAFLYGATGTLNMADLARTLPTIENQGLVTTLGILFLLAFGAKAAVFPLFFWLPAAYHTASAPVVAIFAALLTKVGVYAIIRSFTLMFDTDAGFTGPVIAVLAGLTMVTGVLGAAAHFDTRRILSFHIISQIGYMLIGIAVATPLAIAGSVLYVIHHIVVKANLFLIAGIVDRAGGSFHLKEVGGLYRTLPWLGILFLIPALSLAGLPPLSGFWSKFTVIKASFDAGHLALAATGLVVGALTLYSMLKIWNEAFWKAAPDASVDAMRRFSADRTTRLIMVAPAVALAAITLTIGLAAEPFVDFSMRAAGQLLDKSVYIDAVTAASRPFERRP
ncbi:Na+/H+ antiporter subunit D [Phreatobacter oligotrophus]|jgi:multicomponent Na+:H+ antiporter subunit D|uniref:Multisubunit sodium/proton antiporter MrpD subunit n=1 Tax=Phreatobacter oligotrophus TaxID=1122261 RepID=A0A2T4YWW5_9HYPH|nr:Na+/H+ antiporter subunit D [Phreatobacter oligotrophus]PTM49308.1 multisubunit sodium/proton antiporter MrpD subunit [Phreatobacter oligotrophus]